ncbi:acireductone synthase [Kitasatospora phosalacinea]|uniref:acireductone synthase n=1 Tax=Kitasatospora phosalacinea TaxID=2065 RepID=UPI0035DA8C09
MSAAPRVDAAPLRVDAVVVDIEGTVGSASHVQQVLFPYARARYASWFAARRGRARTAELLDLVRAAAADPALAEAGAVAALTAWTDADVKSPALKAVQAAIWADGYADGTLTGHVYEDVPGALEGWAAAGIARYVYSSGARPAQRDWFRHSGRGDLTPLLDGYFDLDSAGGKHDPDSYRAIGRAIGVPPGRTLFLSDLPGELAAATAAGWHAVGVARDGAPPTGGDLRWVATLAEITLRGPADDRKADQP